MSQNNLSKLQDDDATITEYYQAPNITKYETIRPMKKVSAQAKRDYKEILVNARERIDDIPIPNRYPWHCKLAVSELLKHAMNRQKTLNSQDQVTIRLLTGSLTNHVYDEELRKGLKSLLDANGKVKILIWGEFYEEILDNPLLDMQSKYEGLEIRFSQTTDSGDKLNHFFLVDDDAYRFEAAHPYYPPEQFTDTYPEISARIVFNDKESGTQLKIFFDDIWEKLENEYFKLPLLVSS